MFTGIITDIGVITDIVERDHGLRLAIRTKYDAKNINIGASIACAGVCLTVVERGVDKNGHSWFMVEAWEEALHLTHITSWRVGTRINLERSLCLGDEMGGHLVSGHVDGIAEVVSVSDEGEARRFYIRAPANLAGFIATKGSVALDGTSLTINSVEQEIFDVLLIKHTLEVTTWGQRAPGDKVNIEIDQLARYVARLMAYNNAFSVEKNL